MSALVPAPLSHSFRRPGSWLILWVLLTLPAIPSSVLLFNRLDQAGNEPSLVSLFGLQLMVWYPWILMIPPILKMSERFPLNRKPIQHTSAHLGAALVISLALMAWQLGSELVFFPQTRDLLTLDYVIAVLKNPLSYVSSGLIYALILVIASSINYWRGNRMRETLLTQARLQNLRARLQPHFLFNTLHAVSSLMDDDIPAARRMIARLSDLLRESLYGGDEEEVPLHQELGLLERYLDIERIRFGDRLRITQEVPTDLNDLLVPRLILQPLAENAITHGLGRKAEAGAVALKVWREGMNLHISISDDGPGFCEPIQYGVGLGATRSRLQELYPGASGLKLENIGDGCRVTVWLPCKEAR